MAFSVFRDPSLNSSQPTKLKMMFSGLSQPSQLKTMTSFENNENSDPNMKRNRNAVAPSKATQISSSNTAVFRPKSSNNKMESKQSIYKNPKLNKGSFQVYQDVATKQKQINTRPPLREMQPKQSQTIYTNPELKNKTAFKIYQDSLKGNIHSPIPSRRDWGWEAEKENILWEEVFGKVANGTSCAAISPSTPAPTISTRTDTPSPNSLLAAKKTAIKLGDLDSLFQQMLSQDSVEGSVSTAVHGPTKIQTPAKSPKPRNFTGQYIPRAVQANISTPTRPSMKAEATPTRASMKESVMLSPLAGQYSALHRVTMNLPDL